MEYKLTILVNTTDSFEDCWFPFFTLFKKYWPEFKGKIYLNTETKIYCHDGLNIICIQNNMEKPNNTLKWGECLIRALNFIDDNVILYMQEDYFLKDFVKNDYLDEFVKLISTNIDIDCIHLTDAGGHLGISSSYHDKLNHLISPQRYLANCQAALWKKKNVDFFVKAI